jgi:hypothetical protein
VEDLLNKIESLETKAKTAFLKYQSLVHENEQLRKSKAVLEERCLAMEDRLNALNEIGKRGGEDNPGLAAVAKEVDDCLKEIEACLELLR